MKSTVIGVLSLQGDFAKHMKMLTMLNVSCMEVRHPDDLSCVNALIIPGGESTTMMKQLQFIHLIEPLLSFSKEKPVFGTCAGLILMSQKIIDDPMQPLCLLDVEVSRNAFGKQIDSFSAGVEVKLAKSKPHIMEAVFIRAPRIFAVGKDVQVLASYNGEPVLVQQGRHLGATFHPELKSDPAIHRHFLSGISTS